MGLGWFLYQAAMASSLALAAPYLLARRGGHYLETLPGRLGVGQSSPRPGALWIHAVSVGEVGVAATLARALPPQLPLLITTVTPTGQRNADKVFSTGPFAEREVQVAYLPFDLGFAVRAFYRRFEPSGLILIEGDYWPLVLREAGRRRLPVGVVNGRVGERAYRRMARFRRLTGPLFFDHVQTFGLQTEDDRQRLIGSGAPAEHLHVTGNLKFDTPKPALKPELEDRVRRLAGDRPILLAGSTMAGEEEQVLDAFQELGGGQRALLVLAPRHPERWQRTADLVHRRQLAAIRRSAFAEANGATPGVLLLDSLGELAGLYSLADAAFIGGTLVPTGGHNPLEPAHFAVPTVVGPSMDNFRQIAESFESANAWRRVTDAHGLAEAWDSWLREPADGREVGERAFGLLRSNRGALERTLKLLAPLLETVT